MENTLYPPLDPFIAYTLQIISLNEGKFYSIHQIDGYSSSIGILQWNGTRAKNLLLLIISKNVQEAKKILSETNLIDDLKKDDFFWSERQLTDLECQKVSLLLMSPAGIAAQYEQLTADITSYLDHGRSLGIFDKNALIFFADLENQFGPVKAERILKDIPKSQKLSMLNLLAAAMPYCNPRRKKRRQRTYQNILNLNL